jgi:hypothetical protein
VAEELLACLLAKTRSVTQRKPDSHRESGHIPALLGQLQTAYHYFFLVAVFFFAGAFFAHLPQLTRPTSLLEEICLAQRTPGCASPNCAYHIPGALSFTYCGVFIVGFS